MTADHRPLTAALKVWPLTGNKSMEKEPLDLTTIRNRLAEAKGRQYWRSLEELAGTKSFRELLHREFPQHAAAGANALDRRSFLKLMGASLALAGLTACSGQPPEKIVPYVRPPEKVVPGKPLFFATTMSLGGYGTGLDVQLRSARTTGRSLGHYCLYSPTSVEPKRRPRRCAGGRLSPRITGSD